MDEFSIPAGRDYISVMLGPGRDSRDPPPKRPKMALLRDCGVSATAAPRLRGATFVALRLQSAAFVTAITYAAGCGSVQAPSPTALWENLLGSVRKFQTPSPSLST